ncbi:MAG: molybdopterin molybdenumtransferase MoeA, partial [Chthoniobacterales bacterium]
TEVSNDGERPHYLRGRLQGGTFTVSGLQESHALFGLSRANALLRVASGETFAAGAIVSVELWD